MTSILISFGSGLAFAMGVTTWFHIRVENRLAAQVAAMHACLEEIKRK